jgi:hypothetical protein
MFVIVMCQTKKNLAFYLYSNLDLGDQRGKGFYLHQSTRTIKEYQYNIELNEITPPQITSIVYSMTKIKASKQKPRNILKHDHKRDKFHFKY